VRYLHYSLMIFGHARIPIIRGAGVYELLALLLLPGKSYGLASALVASRPPARYREFAREMLAREKLRDGGKEERHAQSG
jgi:hypothetical protein